MLRFRTAAKVRRSRCLGQSQTRGPEFPMPLSGARNGALNVQARTVVDAGMRMRGGKPQNIIVDSNTRLTVSHLFDSSAALERLTEPEKKDYARLIASLRAANLLVQMWRDLETRILVAAY